MPPLLPAAPGGRTGREAENEVETGAEKVKAERAGVEIVGVEVLGVERAEAELVAVEVIKRKEQEWK